MLSFVAILSTASILERSFDGQLYCYLYNEYRGEDVAVADVVFPSKCTNSHIFMATDFKAQNVRIDISIGAETTTAFMGIVFSPNDLMILHTDISFQIRSPRALEDLTAICYEANSIWLQNTNVQLSPLSVSQFFAGIAQMTLNLIMHESSLWVDAESVEHGFALLNVVNLIDISMTRINASIQSRQSNAGFINRLQPMQDIAISTCLFEGLLNGSRTSTILTLSGMKQTPFATLQLFEIMFDVTIMSDDSSALFVHSVDMAHVDAFKLKVWGRFAYCLGQQRLLVFNRSEGCTVQAHGVFSAWDNLQIA